MALRKILIDTDTGVDDSLAILVALTDPTIEVIGIGSAYGNCRSAQAAENALYVLEVVGVKHVPVAKGVPESASDEKLIALAALAHGRDGLGDAGLRAQDLTTSEENAVQQLLRVSREHGPETGLLALGPLTNLAAAILNDREVLSRFQSVVIMGGMGPQRLVNDITASYGGYFAIGDPNIRRNSVAAELVASADAAITWVGMNVTGPLLLPTSMLDDLADQGSPSALFARATHQLYSEFVTQRSGSPNKVFNVHDTVAAAIMLDSSTVLEMVAATPVVIRDTAGRSAIWGVECASGEQTHRFVTKVDAAAVEKRIHLALGRIQRTHK